ncbi:MAG: tetratricopeptide repeat protein [Cyanobacteria bacterium P01_A01_bin.114]
MRWHLIGLGLLTTGLAWGLPQSVELTRATAIAQSSASASDSSSDSSSLQETGEAQYYGAQLPAALASFETLLEQQTAAGARLGQADALIWLAKVHLDLGQYDASSERAQQAQAIYQTLPDGVLGEAASLRILGRIALNLSQYEEAGRYLEQAREIETPLSEEGNVAARSGFGETLILIGTLYNSQNQAAEAADLLQQALAIHQALGNREQAAWALIALGLSQHRLGENETAQASLAQAFSIIEAEGVEILRGTANLILGLVQYDQGETEAAIATLEQSRSQFEQLGNPTLIALSLENLGRFYAETGDPTAAIETYRQALALREQGDQVPAQVNLLVLIGGVYQQQSQLDAALPYWEQALSLQQAFDPEAADTASLLYLVGSTYNLTGRSEQALPYFQAALTIRQGLGQTEEVASLYKNIGYAHQNLTQYEQAVTAYQQALAAQASLGDVTEQVELLDSIGLLQRQLNQPQAALETYQQSLSLVETIDNPFLESDILSSMALAHEDLGEYPQALALYLRSLELHEAYMASIVLEEAPYGGYILLLTEATLRNNIAGNYLDTGNYEKALSFYNQALEISQTLGDRLGEAKALNNIGLVYDSLSRYDEALELYQQVLTVVRASPENDDSGVSTEVAALRQGSTDTDQTRSQYRGLEAVALSNIASVNNSRGEYSQAIAAYEEVLTVVQELNDKSREGIALNNIGTVHLSQGDYPKAIERLEQAAAIFETLGNVYGQSLVADNLGTAYSNLSEYDRGLTYHQQALAIRQEITDREGEGVTLNNIAGLYLDKGDSTQALDYYQQALAIFQALGARDSEATTLNSIGVAYSNLSEYAKALDYHQQAYTIQQDIGDREGSGTSRMNEGVVYQILGQYDQAQAAYQQALAVFQEIGAKPNEATALHNLGAVYDDLEEYQQAVTYYEQALTLRQTIGDRTGEALSLNNLGVTARNQDNSAAARQYFEQALTLAQSLEVRSEEATALRNLGQLEQDLEDYDQSDEFYQQALVIFQEIEERANVALTLADLGSLQRDRSQPEVAIAFLKRSINITETIRQELTSLSTEQQKSYADTISDTYRDLSDLLLSQGRVIEAQQVLELLKVEELRDYTRSAEVDEGEAEIALTATEQQIVDQYGSLIEFGRQVYDCQRSQCGDIADLSQQQRQLVAQYNQQVSTIVSQIRDNRASDDAFSDPRYLSQSARAIVDAEPGTVLIYPLVMEDRLWVMWVAQGGVVSSVEVPVSQQELGAKVLEFRQLISTPRSDVAELQTVSKQLYDWLMPPQLRAELADNSINNLVYSLDRVTRYIPMAALYDGDSYLLENYSISTVLSAQLTQVDKTLPPGLDGASVLALGVSDSVSGFSPLPNVPQELETIVKEGADDANGVISGQSFLNDGFNFDALANNLFNHRILHLATHGKFESGAPSDSYLLLGNAEKLTPDEITTLYLGDTDLVVLSACETALGGPDAEGVEIAGLGYFFLEAQASAVLASLWQVSDASTSLLMQDFYANLASGTTASPVTKSAALRQAQLSLINSEFSAEDLTSRGFSVAFVPANRAAGGTGGGTFSHPFYWAPFILIGNGR